ncbi:MAG TPA: hypothetical protein VFI96_02940, partial [Longimicrobiaceae bacterium]|nr:hypothetical protein [Longimicrobiaceae bacterium]
TPSGTRSAIDRLPTVVEVDNRSFNDMDVYVLRSSQRIRLGTVNAVSTRYLRLPRGLVTVPIALRFIADPVGGRATSFSQEITVFPGDTVALQIQP